MMNLLTGSLMGLVVGIAIQCTGLTRRERFRAAVSFRLRPCTRTLLMLLGLSLLLSSLLMWLAVIDVDTLSVLPLHGGVLLGGVLFGAFSGWAGLTPGTLLAGLGGDRFWESLCGVAGCMAGAILLPYLQPAFSSLQGWLPASANTFFRVTLDEPYLFSGGFLAQGCLGAVLLALALCIRRPRPAPQEESPAPVETSAEPQDVQEETVVAILPGEEPLVVDAAEPEQEAPDDIPSNDSAESDNFPEESG